DKARTPVDLPPILAPGAVRPPAVSLLMEHVKDGEPAPNFYRASAEIIAYCMLGGDAFAHANDARLASAIERRIEAAIEPGTSLDAKLVLLTLHAKVIQPSVVDYFKLEAAPD